MIEVKVNESMHGRVNNIKFGLWGIADGLVRVASIGYLRTNFQLEHARKVAKKRILG